MSLGTWGGGGGGERKGLGRLFTLHVKLSLHLVQV